MNNKEQTFVEYNGKRFDFSHEVMNTIILDDCMIVITHITRKENKYQNIYKISGQMIVWVNEDPKEFYKNEPKGEAVPFTVIQWQHGKLKAIDAYGRRFIVSLEDGSIEFSDFIK